MMVVINPEKYTAFLVGKVQVVDYEIKPTPKGAYQLIGQCDNKLTS